jgi:hypothetical protein
VSRIVAAVPPGLEASMLLEVRLASIAFSDIFDVLAEDLVRSAEHHSDESKALDAVLGQLRKWQRFVEKVPPEGLSEDQRRGLYGELYYLREYLIPVLGLPESIAAWTGPAGAHQDFQGPGFGIEVKASASKEPQTIRITSERQLDGQGLEVLVLAHLSIEEKVGSGETLPQLVEDLRSRAAESAVEMELEVRLHEAGYHDVHRSIYSRYGYVLRRHHIYDVRDNFPRITEVDLSPGVGNVGYSIAVSECSPYAISVDEFKHKIGSSRHA